jgi:hypothetical protein
LISGRHGRVQCKAVGKFSWIYLLDKSFEGPL